MVDCVSIDLGREDDAPAEPDYATRALIWLRGTVALPGCIYFASCPNTPWLAL